MAEAQDDPQLHPGAGGLRPEGPGPPAAGALHPGKLPSHWSAVCRYSASHWSVIRDPGGEHDQAAADPRHGRHGGPGGGESHDHDQDCQDSDHLHCQVSESVLDKAYMGQLVAVQHNRGAEGGRVFARALDLDLNLASNQVRISIEGLVMPLLEEKEMLQ